MLTLIIGGSGSGKSSFGEELAQKSNSKLYYLATMIPYGDEGKRRVERHLKLRKGKGFETIEALTSVDILRRAGVTCTTFGINEVEVTTSHSITIRADEVLNDEIYNYDVVILPGGMPGAVNLRDNEKVNEIVKKFYDEGKIVAAICAGPITFGKLGIVNGKNATCYPGFEDQLVGHNAGDEVEVNVTFPETYHAENLAGKPVVFNVKVNDVKVKEVPALDDEFAKDTTEFETLAELRADVKAKLEEQAKNAADAEMRNALVEKVSANTEVEVPEAMVQHQIDNMLMELNYQLQYQGLNLEQLLQMTGRGLDELREERRADAERLVKSSLVLEDIAEKENV